MLVIGLSGGIGSGKTTAGLEFEKLGINVIDADDLAREVVAKGQPALAAIAQHFGSDILLADSSLNRAKLRECIFSHPDEKTWLEQLTHPLIMARAQTKIKTATSAYTIYISPLLIEGGNSGCTDRLLIVDCDEQQQLARTTVRDNNSPALVQAIMANQCKRSERLDKADDVLINNGDIEALAARVLDLHQQYLELASNDG